jgi:hypothetical protein
MKKLLFAAVIVALCASQNSFAQKGEKVSNVEVTEAVIGSVVVMKHLTLWSKGQGTQSISISRSFGENELVQLDPIEMPQSSKGLAKMSMSGMNEIPNLMTQFTRQGFKMTGQSSSTFQREGDVVVVETTYTFIKQ